MIGDRLLSTGVVCEIAAVDQSTLDTWCRRGLVKPTGGGGGSGSHRLFTATQAVGLLVAVRTYRSDRGCSLNYFGTIMHAFSRFTESELLEMLDARRPGGIERTRMGITVRSPSGDPELDLNNYPDNVDVRQAYRDVLTAVDKIEKRLSKTSDRRRRRVTNGQGR